MNKKKKHAKSKLMTFLKENRVLLAALSGAAAGIALSVVLGTEKATQVLNSLEGNVKGLTTKLENGKVDSHKDLAGV